MKRSLIICNTTYQLIFSLNIALNAQEEEIDIMLTDRTDFENISENIKELPIFKKVFFIKPKKYYKEKSKNQIRFMHYMGWLTPNHIFKRKYKIEIDTYDKLYAANLTDPFVLDVYQSLKRKNKNLDLIGFEDGYSTYVMQSFYGGVQGFKKILFSVLNVSLIDEKSINYMFLYFPELYMNHDNVIKKRMQIMDFRNERVQYIIKKIFNCLEMNYLNRQYIILEESFQADGIENNAEDIFTYIIDQVGEDHVMLKTHPRNGRNSYHKRDIKVINTPIAWEALIMQEDIEDKVLITCSSGTCINSKLLFHSKCKVIFLYKMLKGGSNLVFQGEKTEEYLERFRKKFEDQVFVPETLEELTLLLR